MNQPDNTVYSLLNTPNSTNIYQRPKLISRSVCLLLPQELEQVCFCFQLAESPLSQVCHMPSQRKNPTAYLLAMYLKIGSSRWAKRTTPARLHDWANSDWLTPRILETDQPCLWETLCSQHYQMDACTKK